MAVETAELPGPARVDPRPAAAIMRGLSGPRLYLWLAGVAVVIAAFSLLIPSTPSYDPWAWLVWGREIIHLNLQTTGGPSWKPLPVLFTTVFAIFGNAEPDLWLVIARAGAIVAVVMTARIASRIMRGISPESKVLPCALAAFLAAGSLVVSSGFVSDNALGYSEGFMTALVLLAIDRHLDGDHRGAFAFGFGAALDRPEIWCFWGLYGLWLFWTDASSRRLVIGMFVAIPVLWFLPELWGSGHLLRGVSRAQHVRSNSAANASCPFCTEFVNHAWKHVLNRIKVPAIFAALAGLGLLWSMRERLIRAGRAALSGSLHEGRTGAAPERFEPTVGMKITLVVVTALGFGWWILIAFMTQAGFSGNDRYLVLGVALVSIGGGVGWAWAGQFLGRLVAARVSGLAKLSTAGGVLAPVALFLAVPPWIGSTIPSLPRTHRALVYQAQLRSGISAAVRNAGGAGAVLRCGTVMTEGFQVPLVAWTLGVHTLRVEASPQTGGPIGPPPNTIFQTRETRKATLLPTFGTITAWEDAGARYAVIAESKTFRVFSTCPRSK
jgi:hypothetical protein